MWEGFVGDRLYLDSNILIHALEEGNPWTPHLRELFVAIEANAIVAVTSEITLAEVLAKPLELGAHALVEAFERTLGLASPIHTPPILRSTLRRAAGLRASQHIKLIDAIHVATAQESDCHFFLTQDDRLGRSLPSTIEWLNLAGMASSESR